MQEFSAKRDALFACLDDASKELRGTALDQSKAKAFSINALDRGNKSGNESGQVMNYRQGRSIVTGLDAEDGRLRRMRGKESIFKKPELPIGRCLKPRKTPDYQVTDHPSAISCPHPKRLTYSLGKPAQMEEVLPVRCGHFRTEQLRRRLVLPATNGCTARGWGRR